MELWVLAELWRSTEEVSRPYVYLNLVGIASLRWVGVGIIPRDILHLSGPCAYDLVIVGIEVMPEAESHVRGVRMMLLSLGHRA